MKTRYVMQRDTPAWRIQVWSAFAVAVGGCAWGVFGMPGDEMDRAFLLIGLFFSLFSCFAVAKTERDNRDGQVDTQGWVITVWIAFAAALSLTAWGLWRMPMDPWAKRYMVLAWLFLVSATFTLSKTVRDKHEAELLERGSPAERSSEEGAGRAPA